MGKTYPRDIEQRALIEAFLQPLERAGITIRRRNILAHDLTWTFVWKPRFLYWATQGSEMGVEFLPGRNLDEAAIRQTFQAAGFTPEEAQVFLSAVTREATASATA